MHSDKKYLKMKSKDGDFEMMPQMIAEQQLSTAASIVKLTDSLGATTPTGSELGRSLQANWMNATIPPSVSTNTLSKRSNRNKRVVTGNNYVKDYIKKRNLILELLAVEIEMLLVRD